jgi:uncharacterized protein (DUF58 family)
MSKKTIGLMAVGCLILVILVGVAGAQLLLRVFLNTGVFTVQAGEIVNFTVSLDEQRGQPPATVLMQLIDEGGAVVAGKPPTVLQPGQSASLIFTFREQGRVRAHAEIIQSVAQLTLRRTPIGSVEIIDSLTGEVVRWWATIPTASIYDPWGVSAGR